MLPVRGELSPATRPPKVPLLLTGCAPQKNAFPRSTGAGTKGQGQVRHAKPHRDGADLSPEMLSGLLPDHWCRICPSSSRTRLTAAP